VQVVNKAQQKEFTMTQCSNQSVLFPDIFAKPVHISFSREELSSNGGTILLAARDWKLGLIEHLADALVDNRQAGKVKHELADQMRQRVFGIAVGCPDCNDAALLREDPLMKMACDRDPVKGAALASQPTLSRFENAVDNKQLLRMSYRVAETVIGEQAKRRRGKNKPRRIIIDLDPTCDPTYGTQQLTMFNGYYDTYCYLPLIVTVSFGWERRKYPVAVALRSGTAGSMVGTLAVVCRLIDLLRQHFGPTRLYLRADSNFAVPEFFDLLEAEQIHYAIAMASNSVLKGISRPAMEQARLEANQKQETSTSYGSTLYKSGGWKHERTAIYKAQVVVHPDKEDHRDNDRYVITNLDSRYSAQGKFDFYYGHSDMENNIKELKNDLSMDRTSCSRFGANQFRILMTLAAYVLMQSVQEQTSDLDLLKAQMGTLRDRLLKVAVRVRSSARRFILEFTGHHPWSDAWLATARALGAVPV
jgi:hypothetical protein